MILWTSSEISLYSATFNLHSICGIFPFVKCFLFLRYSFLLLWALTAYSSHLKMQTILNLVVSLFLYNVKLLISPLQWMLNCILIVTIRISDFSSSFLYCSLSLKSFMPSILVTLWCLLSMINLVFLDLIGVLALYVDTPRFKLLLIPFLCWYHPPIMHEVSEEKNASQLFVKCYHFE